VLADGAYDGEPIYRTVAQRHPDAEVVIPPRSTAVPSDAAKPTPRDRHIQLIAEKGRMGWQAATGYGKWALVETAFHRYKVFDEVYVVAGHKGHPETVRAKGREGRRNRLKGGRGRGTLEKETPPIFGMIERGGQVVIRMLPNLGGSVNLLLPVGVDMADSP
jgi:hypothetical protein